jgi:hypothetical protein
MKRSPLRVLAAASIVAAGFCFVLGVYIVGLSDENAAERDFISYWAAGQQLMHGKNPYDLEAVRALELAAGRPPHEPLLTMRNPPVAFFLAAPLGLVSPKTGLILWLLVLLGGLSASIWILWLVHGRPDNRFHLFGYVFAPAIACLMAAQFGIFLLIGVVLFLHFHRSRPFLAGAALLLCALKPHLFLPFGIVLILWAVRRKTYLILAGFAAALFASCALSFALDPHAWSQYSYMMHAGGALDEAVPALSVSFRFLIDRHAVWLQFVPEAAACMWGVWYFWTRRDRWNWMDHGLLLLLVGAMCTPFGWFTDESMLLPAVLAGLYHAANSRRSLLPLGLITGTALIEVFANIQITSPYFMWTTPAWLAWYLYATGKRTAPAATGATARSASATPSAI